MTTDTSPPQIFRSRKLASDDRVTKVIELRKVTAVFASVEMHDPSRLFQSYRILSSQSIS